MNIYVVIFGLWVFDRGLLTTFVGRFLFFHAERIGGYIYNIYQSDP